MHIIYLGSVTSKEEVAKLSGGSVAGNKMQWNVLTELKKYSDVSIDAFSILSIAAFPKEKRLFVREEKKEISKGVYVTQIPFLNIPILKQWMQSYELFKYAKRAAGKNSIGFSFNLYMQEGTALIKLKKRCNLKIVSLLADLPIDDNYSRKGIMRFLYQYFFKRSKRNISECDHLIVLNECAVKEYAPAANYIVVEGGVEAEESGNYKEQPILQKNIVYSGALTEYSGISELVLAMKDVKEPEIILEIYGDGPLKEWIEEQHRDCHNVVYKGKVTNQEMIRIQQKAWLLVNPRPVDDKIAKVTFPSKIFEYMVSGRPVLSTALTGFTKEYRDRMFIAQNNSPKCLADMINLITDIPLPQLQEKANDARKFILSEKTWTRQTERIFDFLKEIEIKG